MFLAVIGCDLRSAKRALSSPSVNLLHMHAKLPERQWPSESSYIPNCRAHAITFYHIFVIVKILK